MEPGTGRIGSSGGANYWRSVGVRNVIPISKTFLKTPEEPLLSSLMSGKSLAACWAEAEEPYAKWQLEAVVQ